MDEEIKNLLEFSIINIDKPSGPTSFTISDMVRKMLDARKTSHFGTLDPKVTGVLPVAINRACKLTGHFIGHDKEYVGIMRFHEEISMDKVKDAIKRKFIGKIKQTPPVKSRVKRQEREREIKKFEVLEREDNKKDFLFHCEVQGGTYIRKLVDDLGKELKIGAHMLKLRRTRAGIFSEKDSVTLHELEKTIKENKLKDILMPAEKALKEIYPFVKVKEKSIKQLFTGKPLEFKMLKDKQKKDKDILINAFNTNEQFIGIYKVINDGKNKIFANPEFVLQPLNEKNN